MQRVMDCRVRQASRGMSIVELLIGIAIGLFILAAATMLVSNQLGDNRRLMLETQIQQDLRATMDMVVRDVRRSGHWYHASTTAWPSSAGAVAPNPYAVLNNHAESDTRSELLYAYTSAFSADVEDDAVDSSEQFGFALNSTAGTIEMKVGGSGWQTLTDPNVMVVTEFTHTINTQQVAVPCAKACPVGSTTCPPMVQVSDVAVQITGQATHDPSVRHTVSSNVRVRNDALTGACPA